MQKKQKILYIITKSNWGGAQRYVYDLAARLPKEQFDVVIAAGGSGGLFTRLNESGIRSISIPSLARDAHFIKDIQSFFKILHICLRERPDVIHLNSSKVGGIGALAARVAQVIRLDFHSLIVFTVHGWGTLEQRSFSARSAIHLASWIMVRLLSKIILINNLDLRIAERFTPRKKLVFIPNGLTQIKFMERKQARAFFTEQLHQQIHPDSILIGTVTELTKNKGLGYLIDAIDLMDSVITHHKARVLIIGEGEDHRHLQQLITSHGLNDIVFLLGFIPEASQYLKGLDIFLLSSIKEGLPYVVMEAMSAGLPVIGTEVGGVTDLIYHNHDGMLIPARDSAMLAHALMDLIYDKEKQKSLGAFASDKISKYFKVEDMLQKTISVYTKTETNPT